MPANERVWNRQDIVRTYASRSYLTPAEVRVIATCWPALCGGAVLDIGVGTGRTISYLAPFAARYAAIDLAPRMVEEAQRQHSGVEIRQADARALPFPAATFSFVLFSFNGIDYISPAERPRVLAEVRRVLVPGGVFAYSTHNLASRGDARPAFAPSLPHVYPAHPVRSAISLASSLAATVRGFLNYRRLEDDQQVTPEVAFVNDGAHDYGVLTCYVTQDHERRALADAGFVVREIIEREGGLASASSRAKELYFVADLPH
jgi:SAM-dependent methyltransferase